MLWRMRTWARERLPKQRSVSRKGRTAVCTLHEGLFCVCPVSLPASAVKRPRRCGQIHVETRSSKRHNQKLVLLESRWPGDLDLCLSNSSGNPRSQYPTLVVSSTSFSTDQLHLVSSNCTSCRSLFTFVGHRPRAPSSLPPSPSASLVLSTELLPSLMLLLPLELPRWTLITLRCHQRLALLTAASTCSPDLFSSSRESSVANQPRMFCAVAASR